MSIFNLKTDIGELKSSNSDCSDLKYSEYLPTKDSVGNSFPNSRFVIPFEMSAGEWWLPSRSYMRMRFDLHGRNGPNKRALTSVDNIAPAYNMVANLFQSMEFQLNGNTISKCSQFVAEVDTLEQRLSKSKAWLDSIGGSINWLYEDVHKRISMVSSDGNNVSLPRHNHTSLSFADPSIKFEAKVNSQTVELTGAALGGNTTQAHIDELNRLGFTYGSILHINGEAYKLLTPTLNIANTPEWIVDRPFPKVLSVATSEAIWYLEVDDKRSYYEKNRGNLTGFELIWSPKCLSIFKYSGALPCGKYQLICTPHNNSGNNYKNRAVEVPQSLPPNHIINWGSGNNQFEFNVGDVRFFCCNIKSKVVDELTYYIDLEETRLQKAKLLNSNNLSKEYFNVSPSTYALTYAVQNVNAGNDVKFSPSRFSDDKNELSMNRLYIQYGNKQFPSPDADCSFNERDDYTTQRYINTAMNCGAYYSEGGWEDIETHHKLGALHYFEIPKGAEDRSTRATVNVQYNLDFKNANHLLFDHYRNVIQVNIKNGAVVDVRQYDI